MSDIPIKIEKSVSTRNIDWLILFVMVSYKMESNTFSKIYILEAKEGFPKKDQNQTDYSDK